MAKSKEKDVITKTVKENVGKERISPGGDFGAREAFAEAAAPPSVKKMVGSDKEFSSYKHDLM